MSYLDITKNSGCSWVIENLHGSSTLNITIKLMGEDNTFEVVESLSLAALVIEADWTPGTDGIYSFEFTESATDYIYYLFVDCTLISNMSELSNAIICEDVNVCHIDTFAGMILLTQGMYTNLTTDIQGQSWWSTVPANITTLITDINTIYQRISQMYEQYTDGDSSGCNC